MPAAVAQRAMTADVKQLNSNVIVFMIDLPVSRG
jgi:hypothetical protein